MSQPPGHGPGRQWPRRLMGRRLAGWPALGMGALLIGLALLGSWLGWYGAPQICGADAAAVCARWPAPLEALTWLLLVGAVAALLVWQALDWRRD